ncbi:hypothetical protein VNO77_19381 [Canavalia gladiata]|uniref:Uncharacterized protein n=1 Tax=Canavalia gladiata TaxID=3824 RepID=A0AAN9QIF8_CANGL
MKAVFVEDLDHIFEFLIGLLKANNCIPDCEPLRITSCEYSLQVPDSCLQVSDIRLHVAPIVQYNSQISVKEFWAIPDAKFWQDDLAPLDFNV